MQTWTVQAVIDWFRHRFPCGRSNSAHEERCRLLRLFCDRFGQRPYDQLDADDLEDFVRTTGKADKAANTIDRWYRTIKRPFKAALKRRKIAFCPLDGIEAPRGNEGRDLTRAEFVTLLKHATKVFRLVLCFVRYSGARPGEMSRLTWPMVEAECADLLEHKTFHATGKARRIWWNRRTLRILAYMKRHAVSEYVFINSYGNPWQTRALCKNLQTIRKKAGLADDVKLYGCRHLFGTDAYLNLGDIAIVAELMGHRTYATTKRYVHLADKREYMRKKSNEAVDGFRRRQS